MTKTEETLEETQATGLLACSKAAPKPTKDALTCSVTSFVNQSIEVQVQM